MEPQHETTAPAQPSAPPSAPPPARPHAGPVAHTAEALRIGLVGGWSDRPAENGPSGALSGIGRYVQQLRQAVGGHVRLVPCRLSAARLSRVPLLRQLPLRVEGASPELPLHFPQITGAGALCFGRYRGTVVTVHDLGHLSWAPERRMLTRATRLLLAISFRGLRQADWLIAVSRFTAAALTDVLGIPPEKVRHVAEAVDHATFHPGDGAASAGKRVAARTGIGEFDHWRTLLAVTSEIPRKNVGLLLETVAALKARGERVRLVKVGAAGGARYRQATLEAIERLGVAGHVHLLEGIDDETLADLYRATDAYVCASHLEGFSLPTLEAMACGTPVVVSDAGALPELVADAGIVVRSPSAVHWVEAIEGVLAGTTLAARLRERGPQRAGAFTLERMAEETLAVYRSLASNA